MLARGILGSGQTWGVSFSPFPNSSVWWWLISSVFLTRTSCCETAHANSYYGAWPGWAVSISVLLLTYLLVLFYTEGGNRQNRPCLESRTPTWAGPWILSYMPSIYGNDIPTGKPDPTPMEESQGSYLDSLSPKRIP